MTIYARAEEILRRAFAAVVANGKVGTPLTLALVRHGVGTLIVVDPQRGDDDEAKRDLLTIPPDYKGDKVAATAALVSHYRPAQRLVPLAMTFEQARDAGFLREADIFLSCASQPATRTAVVQYAGVCDALVVSAAVSIDGLAGEVVVWHPARRGQVACPACLLPPPGTLVAHDDGLPLATTDMAAALAYAALLHTLEHGLAVLDGGQVWQYDALTLCVERLRVRPRPDCPACASLYLGGESCHS